MLELRSVSAGYGSFRALFDVSLEVRDGEAVGVIGRNGAGKTTLMRAMCAIGRALMSQPKILLMDEPSAGLAPLVVAQVFDLVRRIRSEGLTVLIVEQNVQQVLDVVDRAYVIEVGAIKLAGTSAELRNNTLVRQAYMGL